MSDSGNTSVDYDVDKRFARLRVEVLGNEYTDVVRVREQFPGLPDGVTVYLEHADDVDLKQETEASAHYPRVEGECPECGCESLFLGDGGYVTCSRIDCSSPSSPSEVLGAI